MQTNQPTQNPTPTNQPTDSLPSSTAPTPQPEVPKKKLPKWPILLIIVLLLGATGVFAYQYYQLKQQLTDQSVPLTQSGNDSPTPTATPIPTTNPIASWKIYSNESIIPITFRYPAELNLAINQGLMNDKYTLIYLDTKPIDVPVAYGGDLTPIEIHYPQPGNSLDESLTRSYEEQMASAREQVTPES